MKVRIHKDGTVTVSGISGNMLSSILTAATLYRYDQASNDHKIYVAEKRKDALKYEAEGNTSMAECVRENIQINLEWFAEFRKTIAELEKGLKGYTTFNPNDYDTTKSCGICGAGFLEQDKNICWRENEKE